MPTVEVPIPPSANHIWRAIPVGHAVKVLKSRAYRSWSDVAALVMRAGLPRYLRGPLRVVVTIRGGKGFPTSRDLDNCLKPCLDALRHAEVIPGDSVRVVVDKRVWYSPPARKGDQATCLVTVEEVAGG